MTKKYEYYYKWLGPETCYLKYLKNEDKKTQ